LAPFLALITLATLYFGLPFQAAFAVSKGALEAQAEQFLKTTFEGQYEGENPYVGFEQPQRAGLFWLDALSRNGSEIRLYGFRGHVGFRSPRDLFVCFLFDPRKDTLPAKAQPLDQHWWAY
jgi:hypothetical protein